MTDTLTCSVFARFLVYVGMFQGGFVSCETGSGNYTFVISLVVLVWACFALTCPAELMTLKWPGTLASARRDVDR